MKIITAILHTKVGIIVNLNHQMWEFLFGNVLVEFKLQIFDDSPTTDLSEDSSNSQEYEEDDDDDDEFTITIPNYVWDNPGKIAIRQNPSS